jgi:hypothetical protein
MGKHAVLLPIQPRLIDEATAAAYVGRSRTAFRAQVASGTMPTHVDSNGNVKLWDVRALDAHVDRLANSGQLARAWDA